MKITIETKNKPETTAKFYRHELGLLMVTANETLLISPEKLEHYKVYWVPSNATEATELEFYTQYAATRTLLDNVANIIPLYLNHP